MDWSFCNTMTRVNWQHPGFPFLFTCSPSNFFSFVSNAFEIWKGLYHFLIAWIMPLSYQGIWVYFANSLSVVLNLSKTIHFSFEEKEKYFPFHYSLLLEKEVGMGDMWVGEAMTQTKTSEAWFNCVCHLPGGHGLKEFLIEMISCTISFHHLLKYSTLLLPQLLSPPSFK